MNLLVAICGDQINSYRSKIEALVATLNANARFVKTRQDGGQKKRRMSRWFRFYVGRSAKRRRRSVGSATASDADVPGFRKRIRNCRYRGDGPKTADSEFARVDDLSFRQWREF